MRDTLRPIADGAHALLDGCDAFTEAHAGAHRAATSPWNNHRPPTKAQAAAGNYLTGPVPWQGLSLRIENPAHTVREGIGEDGVPWRNLMQAHYGYITGTRGADGDGIDVFLGPFPESERLWVLNQTDAAGAFDEHKLLAGFVDERHAVDAYRLSYTAGWDRYEPPIPLSLSQLRWWLKNADTTRKLTPDLVPPEPETMNDIDTPAAAPALSRVFWDSAANPMSGATLADVLYAIRANDAAEGLVMDAMTMADITEGCELLFLDALVTLAGKLKPKMEALLRVMEAAGGEVKPLALQISEPMRRYGGVHVAALFELSDGQTITVWFHNPDTTPAKFTPADDLVSWKWQLNKKDITIVVAPESGQDLNLREVARRLMRLAAKNSAAFQRANVKRAATMTEISDLRLKLADRQALLTNVMGQIEVAKVEGADRAAAKVAADAQRAAEAAAAEAALALQRQAEAAQAAAGTLPPGWKESAPGRVATNADPKNGGIVDKQIAGDKWFVVANDDGVNAGLKDAEFDTRSQAFSALQVALDARDAAPEPVGALQSWRVTNTSGYSEVHQADTMIHAIQAGMGEVDYTLPSANWSATPLGGAYPAPAPAPADSAAAAFLRDVNGGYHDALALGDMLDKIETAIQELSDAGALVGAVDQDAQAAITRWVTMDEKANG
jgi:hypothetical protein